MNWMYLSIPLRNLIANRVTTLIVGSIMAFGTFLVVIGTSLLDSIDQAMAQSIKGSVAGDLQVYSSSAKDKLAIFGSGFMAADDIGELQEFEKVTQSLEDVDGIEAIIPMGITINSLASNGNRVDRLALELQTAYQEQRQDDIELLLPYIASIAEDLLKDVETAKIVSSNTEELDAKLETLKRFQLDPIKAAFHADPNALIQALESDLAPLNEESRLTYFRNLGTNIPRFIEHFDRFELVKGTLPPSDQRSYLIADRIYERFLKNRVARTFDRIKKAREEDGELISESEKQKERADSLPKQYRKVTYELGPKKSIELKGRLNDYLKSEHETLVDALKEFLTIDDDNFYERYEYFYANIAPEIQLYFFNLGDEITLRGVTKAGYFKSLNVKFYGTFKFQGLDSSDLAGAINLLDMVTFRELYGQMNAQMQAELQDIQSEMAINDISAENAEDALFGDDTETDAEEAEAVAIEDYSALTFDLEDRLGMSLDPTELDEGLALNAAVIFSKTADPTLTRERFEKRIANRGIPLQVVDWQSASGLVGSFIVVLNGVLFVAIFIIFLVALVIINNAMTMATVERVAEIGTMRAIGAQRGFVMWIFMIETLALGLIAGIIGAGLGGALIEYLHVAGLPAPAREIRFLFSGPKLYPTLGIEHLSFGFISILIVSLLSTFYPARLATQIEPVVAMQVKE